MTQAEKDFDNLKNRMNGQLDIFVTPKYGTKTPYSFVSKTCHIINHRDYPVIYDSHTKQCFGITPYMKKDKKRKFGMLRLKK